ncbi:MAG: YigZ family protein [Ruminococcaceae bacterium]|nr:YigZ family protein [Oscillospiraceae bacterium]
MKNDYRTIKQAGRAEYVEKKSRFIASVRPVETEEEALAFIQEIRKMYPDAKHHVYAYMIRDNNIARFSDDGEPGGTAGMPMMEVIKQEELTNIVLVVTRYFGGILLGTGGLVRAYSKSAKLGIDAGTIALMTDCTLLQIDVTYELYGRLQYLLEQEGLTIEKSNFGQAVSVMLYVRTTQVDALQKKIIETTGGRGQCQILGNEYRPLVAKAN